MLIKIVPEYKRTYENLSQIYEAEFALITGSLPNEQGQYRISTELDEDHTGWLMFEKGLPVGFMVTERGDGFIEVCEFFVLPSFRGRGIGRSMMAQLFEKHPGILVSTQLLNAQKAQNAQTFNRLMIEKYSKNNFSETI